MERKKVLSESKDADDEIIIPNTNPPGSPRGMQTTRITAKTPGQVWIKKAQRFLSDCSMGQHYHVFFHKRRYSYGSPVCGFISLVVYLLIIYYMILKFYLIFARANYTNVETYKPIDFGNNNITISDFLQSIDMEIAIKMYQNETYYVDCTNFITNNQTTLTTNNPPMQLELYVKETQFFEAQCMFHINMSSVTQNVQLQSNFTMNFTCTLCTEGYNVGLKEYYVNSEIGMYSNTFRTQQNNQFRQI